MILYTISVLLMFYGLASQRLNFATIGFLLMFWGTVFFIFF